MLGTAPPARRLLLVEQPGPWGPRTLVDSRADPRVAEGIGQRAAALGCRLQAVRHPGRHAVTPGRHEVALVDVERRTTYRWAVDDLADLLGALEDAGDLMALVSPAEVDKEPFYLVCTHGRHDACCALRGRPLAQALDAVRPGRVWETTHLGGDRFAANLAVLPYGELYGRVLPFAAADLVGYVERGAVVPGLMRGRLGMPPLAQAALVYAHEQLALVDRDAIVVQRVERLSDSHALVTLDTTDGPVVVELAMTTSAPAQLTCRGPAEATARAYRGVRISRAT